MPFFTEVSPIQQQQQSLFALTFILALSKKKVTKLNEIIKSKIGVLAAWNNHKD